MHAVRAPIAFDGRRFLPDGATVLVEEDRIVGVEPFGCDLPDDCTVEAFDGTLLPGLFDSHTHLISDGAPDGLERAGAARDGELDATIEESLRAHVRGGVTTVRDLGDRRYRAVAARDRSASGLPRIVAAGPPLTEPDGHCHYLGGVVSGPAEITAAIDEHRDHGVDVIKVMASGGMVTPGTDVGGTQFTPDDLRTVVDVAHAAGLAVLAHSHSLAGIEHALAAGVDGIEHFTGLTPTGIEVPDAVLDRVVADDVIIDPTFGFDRSAFDGYTGPPLPIVVELAKVGLDIDTMLERRQAVVARLRSRGARIVAGMDSGAAPTKRHGRMDLVLDEFVAAGFPMDETLATATSVAAQACGLSDVTGALRPGLAADLLVVDGDLRDGTAPLRSPLRVMVRGVDAGP